MNEFDGDMTELTAQPKPFWKILDEYDRTKATEPLLKNVTLPQFAAKMNELTGSQKYNEGLNDSWLRRGGANIERSLRHFGGANYPEEPTIPGIPATKGLPTLSETFGGPRTGYDILEGAHHFGKSTAESLGAGPELSEAVGGGAEGVVKSMPSLIGGIGLGPVGMGAVAGLETYGEKGTVLPAAVSGLTAGLFPKFAEIGGNAALKAIGAKTVGELEPGLANIINKTAPEQAGWLSKLSPRSGFSPAALAERGARFGGAQAGMFAGGQIGGTAETLVDPTMDWQEKLQQIGHQYSPSSLVASGIAQLPFTAFDLFQERTHPLSKVKSVVRGDFARRFVEAAVQGDPETGSKPFLPTPKQVIEVMTNLEQGKVQPLSKEGEVLKSMGNLPVGLDLTTPVTTAEESVPVPDMINQTRTRAEQLLVAQEAPSSIGETMDQTVYDAIRAVEKKAEKDHKPIMRDDLAEVAAQSVVDKYWKDLQRLETQNKQPEKPGRLTSEQASLERQLEKVAEIVAAIDPSKKETYDQEAHKRVAIFSGKPEEWADAGIKDPITYMGSSETRDVDVELGEWKGKVKRAVGRPMQLVQNILDTFAGRPPRAAEEVAAHLDEINEAWEVAKEQLAEYRATLPQSINAEQYRKRTELQDKANYLKQERARLKNELEIQVSRGFDKSRTGGGRQKLEARATQEGLIRAFNYGRSPEDKAEGRVLDWNDPDSVTRFIRNVRHAMKMAEIGATRVRGTERILPDEFATPELAENAAKEHETLAKVQTDRGDWSSSFSVERDADGKPKQFVDNAGNVTYRIKEEPFYNTRPIFEQIDAEPEAAGLGDVETAMRLQEMHEGQNLTQMGYDLKQLSDNLVERRMRELGLGDDPAEAAARKWALASNAAYYLQQLTSEDFKRILLRDFAVKMEQMSLRRAAMLKKLGIEPDFDPAKIEIPTSMRRVDQLRDQMIKYLYFLRDGGRVETYEKNGRIVGGPPEALIALNKYMGELGHGNYSMTDKVEGRRGKPMIHKWNADSKAGLNFFEMFSVMMDSLRKELIDPRGFVNVERLPTGDFGWLPKGFVDKSGQQILIKWGPELEKGLFGVAPEKVGAFPKAQRVQLDVRDRQGNPVTLAWKDRNPLITFFTESAKRDLVMPLHQMLGLFRDHGALDADSAAMAEIAQKLINNSAFIRDMPVGAGIAKDADTKAYFHTDGVLSSAGIYLSPFSMPKTFEGPSGKFIRELMAPNDFFPHLMNEIGHSAADFAYNSDAAFKAEVNKVFEYVNQFLDIRAKQTGQPNEYIKRGMHALQDPREFLASVFNDKNLHTLLKEIAVPFDWAELPARGGATSYVGTLFDRVITAIRDMLTRLFGLSEGESTTMMNRMADLASRAFDMQTRMSLSHEGDIYHEIAARQESLFGPTGRLEPPPPTERAQPSFVSPPRDPFDWQQRETIGIEYYHQMVDNAARDVAADPKDQPAKRRLERANDALNRFVKYMGGPDPQAYHWTLNAAEFRLARAESTLAMIQQYGNMFPRELARMQEEIAHERQLVETLRARQAEGGTLLRSREAQEDQTEVVKPIFNIAGRKGTLLRDPVVNNIVTTFAAGNKVKDAFSGSGQTAHFAKAAGADHVTLNVFRPDMYQVFNEVKTNPRGFGQRVANAVRQIDSVRSTIPKMRDGSDLMTYLDAVQTRDPSLGLYVKQNLSYFGREVGKETFTPSATITNKGLSELPSRIRDFSKAIDELTNDDGWNVVASGKTGDHIIADPPYVGEISRYGTPPITVEQRLGEYEKNLYPAVARGARFIVFDVADPRLMQSLVQHGFTVQPVQRTARKGGVPREEFIAYNHKGGELLASKEDGQAALDSMNAASTFMADGPSEYWFRPYDPDYFANTYAPVFGTKMRYAPRGSDIGFAVPHNAINSLTQADFARMPRVKLHRWAPSLFETLSSRYRAQGSDQATANALATQMLEMGALLRNSEYTTWGKMPHLQEGKTVTNGLSWGWGNMIGLGPNVTKGTGGLVRGGTAALIRHEATHGAGFRHLEDTMTPDVKAAFQDVNKVFEAMSVEERKAFLDALAWITTEDNKWYGRYERAVTDPAEFAAEYMSHVGDVLGNIPENSQYMKEQMRFVPDEMSRLLVKHSLRRMQGLDQLQKTVEAISTQRDIKDKPWQRYITDLTNAFKSIARPALDISFDQAEFYRARSIFPDQYKALIKTLDDELVANAESYKKAGGTSTYPTPRLLASKENTGGLEQFIRKFLNLPDPANLPTKLGVWDRQFTQFGQFAFKHPTARSAWDMFANARGLFSGFKIKLHTALAGSFEGGKPSDDARTRDVHAFIRDPKLRDAFSSIALDLNLIGDNLFKKELKAKGGDIMAMDSDAITGFLTPAWIDGAMRKYGVPEKDRAKFMTVLDGTRAQVKTASSIIVGSAIHDMESGLAKAVSRHLDLPPEQSRETAQLLADAVKLMDKDPVAAQDKLAEFQGRMKTPEVFEKMVEFATAGWENIRTLERFLVLRMPYFMSERRPGQYGLFYREKDGKITSRYYKSDAERANAIKSKGLGEDDIARLTNPGDRDYGISPTIFNKLNEAHTRMKEKLQGLFGKDEAEALAATMDIATDLREALNARDVLKLTTGRKLAPGREELDMFAAHQQYINAISRAAFNKFVRSEAELLNLSPDLNTEPAIKDFINRQVKAVLIQDSPFGQQMQNLGFTYYLWGNVSSMILQAADQFTGMAPVLTMHGATVAGSYEILRKANLMVAEARMKGKYKDPMIQQMMERARRDGVLGSWISRELDITQDLPMVNRMRATTGKGLWKPFDLLKNRLYQGYGMLRRLYDIVPIYNSEVGLVASMLLLRSKAGGSLTGEELYKQSQFVKELAMYPGGKENRPGFFQHIPRSAAQSVWSLQTYANGLTTMLGEMIRRSFTPKGVTPAQAKSARRAAAQALFTQVALSGVLGLPFAQGLMYALQKLFPEHNVEQDVREMLAGLFGDDEEMGNAFSSAMTIGIPGAFDFAPDVGSRFALSGLFHVSPYSGVNWTDLVGPSGGILSNVFHGAQAGVRGDPMGTVRSMMPVGFQRIWDTLESGTTYRTGTEQMVVKDLRPEEIVSRAIGFRVGRVHRIEEFERLSHVTQDSEKAEQTRWTRERARKMIDGQDAEVRQDIAQRVADTKGVYPAEQLANDIAREVERETMPLDLRSIGNRATILAQKSLLGTLGTQSEGPSNVERLLLQQNIAHRLGLGGPSRGTLRHAMRVDQLLQLYPHLTTAQANVLLTHAARSRPTVDLYQELLGEYQ